MNNKRTHYLIVDISSGAIDNMNNALRGLHAISRYITRKCIKEKINCLALVVTSESESSSITKTHRGSIRAPYAKKISPHIHITLLVEGQSTFEKIMRKYLTKKYGNNIFTESIYDYDHLHKRIPYCISQSQNFQIVNTTTNDFAKQFAGDFVELVKESLKQVGYSKNVFSQYNNTILSNDESVFEFSRSLKYNNNSDNQNKVLTKNIKIHPTKATTKRLNPFISTQKTNYIAPISIIPTTHTILNSTAV